MDRVAYALRISYTTRSTVSAAAALLNDCILSVFGARVRVSKSQNVANQGVCLDYALV
jgi:hypothetical protein